MFKCSRSLLEWYVKERPEKVGLFDPLESTLRVPGKVRHIVLREIDVFQVPGHRSFVDFPAVEHTIILRTLVVSWEADMSEYASGRLQGVLLTVLQVTALSPRRWKWPGLPGYRDTTCRCSPRSVRRHR